MRSKKSLAKDYTKITVFAEGVRQIIVEKKEIYGWRDTFLENNANSYDNAIGSIREKLREFQVVRKDKKASIRTLLKAAAWLYLIYEMELKREQKPDRSRSDSYPQRARS